jgi:hypothetical protein
MRNDEHPAGIRDVRFTSILLKNSVSAGRRLASWAAFGEAELALCTSGGEDRRREGDEHSLSHHPQRSAGLD